MPSPFPGMDPWLEAHWRDVHARLVIYASDALQAVLPRALRARVEESVLLETPQGFGDHPLYPDVRVVEYTTKRRTESRSVGATAVAEPHIIATEDKPVVEPYLEIIDRASGNKVVTVLEFLSPSNKSPGPNREQYLRKQQEIGASDANLVEIDLNRFGIHTLSFPLECLKREQCTSYMVGVRRATKRGNVEVYSMPLWERLPAIRIPLRPKDADVPLDLQALVDQCYRNGGYEGTLNYTVDPDPPLDGPEAEWAADRLHEVGLRRRKKPPRRKGKRKPR